MSAKFPDALDFLTNLADNTGILFIPLHSTDCLQNLSDKGFLLILVLSRDCLLNLADNTEFLFILVQIVDCLSNFMHIQWLLSHPKSVGRLVT